MIILPFIPILALLLQTSFSLYDILQYRSEVNEIESQVNIIVLCWCFVRTLSRTFEVKLMNEHGLRGVLFSSISFAHTWQCL